MSGRRDVVVVLVLVLLVVATALTATTRRLDCSVFSIVSTRC
jgi:hypothetical protein